VNLGHRPTTCASSSRRLAACARRPLFARRGRTPRADVAVRPGRRPAPRTAPTKPLADGPRERRALAAAASRFRAYAVRCCSPSALTSGRPAIPPGTRSGRLPKDSPQQSEVSRTKSAASAPNLSRSTGRLPESPSRSPVKCGSMPCHRKPSDWNETDSRANGIQKGNSDESARNTGKKCSFPYVP